VIQHVQKFAKLSIIQPGIARFCSNFVQISITTLDIPRTFKVHGSKVRVTACMAYQHQNSYDSGTDKLSKVKLGENYLKAKCHTLADVH